ncbi:MAG: DEAD/DEAH box helicase family protein [Muribaculaceae bacterium]|nr:DEAD/DEAH box helicase family protein [Muribaculaceae bacterium]
MKFKFKIQQYQTDAVENTVAVFAGQPSFAPDVFRHDLGKSKQQTQTVYAEEETGYKNHKIELNALQLLDNIRKVQSTSEIIPSESLVSGIGAVNLDIEMETGTGKTYVYIKTMFELHKRYGWNKYIIVVPSIAIREGVAKSFSMLEDHFMDYGEKARWFIYNSGNLQQLDTFAQDAGLNVMIINTQAFAASFKEGGRSKESRIIYTKRDPFGSRRPIEVIAENNPIIIMDEPQKMGGDATQTALKRFNPLFSLNYSATHKTKHNTIYALDALDAYNQGLVKKIIVKGFEIKNLRGINGYIYIDSIILSKNHPPQVKIELEVKNASGEIRRRTKIFDSGDNLYVESGLKQYEDFVVSEINPYGNYVSFLNGETLMCGEVVGDSSEIAMQRVQIRQTIVSHFEKERELFEKGIKTLSLFFIDEVAKYKSYNENGEEEKEIFQQIFEEEYTNILNEKLSLFSDDYQRYLRQFEVSTIHKGYFSIDKKGHAINSKADKKSDLSDDISAYDLILKNKERLLSFEEPTRFIFSHSALREGWDNPNVFQICTLRHANSSTAKRQEVGRGLRICVDKDGIRMDRETLGDDIHKINRLTVIANESYANFSKALQSETKDILRERAVKATADYFKNKAVKEGDEIHVITESEASRIIVYLEDNEYIDDKNNITQKYREAVVNKTVEALPAKLAPIAEGVYKLINSIYDPKALENLVENGSTPETPDNKLNDNFYKAEFKTLWKEINHQYVYTVHYDSKELITKSIESIDRELTVTELKYVMVEGEQIGVDSFGKEKSVTKNIGTVSNSTVKYDLVGEISRGATLTRKTTVEILKRMNPMKMLMFKQNPEEFIRKVKKLITAQKATMIVDHIKYNITEGKYDSDIFTASKRTDFDKAYQATKHITDYVFTDGVAEKSIERKFAEELDAANEVAVYAKLPRTFHIPTPVGNYAPDWAIAFNKGTVKHIFFIAETKGSMDSMDLRAVEKAKIECAEHLFNDISTSNVRYHKVDNYQNLLDVMKSVD